MTSPEHAVDRCVASSNPCSWSGRYSFAPQPAPSKVQLLTLPPSTRKRVVQVWTAASPPPAPPIGVERPTPPPRPTCPPPPKPPMPIPMRGPPPPPPVGVL